MCPYPKDTEDLDCVTTLKHANYLYQLHTNTPIHPKDMEDLDCATIAILANDHS